MISAVILNYKDVALTKKCVDILYRSADASDLPVEVIVVDNSAPQTAEDLCEELPEEVKIIENEKNLGFSAANNQGIKQAKGDIILIMNNDLFINEEVLQTGSEYITSHKKAGVWAPKLVGEFSDEQKSCAYFPTIHGLIIEYWFKYPYSNRVALTAVNADHPVPVDMVIGACMFIRKEVLEQAGLFDEDYFFTSEDVDLCYKIKNLGYEVLFDPRVEAVHLTSASQDYTWYDDPHLHEARKLYFKKHFNSLKATTARFIISSGIKARKVKHNLF